MKIFDYEKNDFSNEGIACVGLLLEMGLAQQIIVERFIPTLEFLGIHGSLFQKSKKNIKQINKLMKKVVELLEDTYDSQMMKICAKDESTSMETWDVLHGKANDLIQLYLIYWSRCDLDMEKAVRMKKALLNFKQDDDCKIDLKEMLKFFNCNMLD